MKPNHDQLASTGVITGKHQRNWRRYIIAGVLLLAVGATIISLLNNDFALTSVSASELQAAALEEQSNSPSAAFQPQGTPPTGMRPQGVPGGRQGAAGMFPNMPITATVGMSDGLPALMSPPILTEIPAAEAIPTPTVMSTVTPTARPAGIVAVAGSNGAAIYTLDGAELLQAAPVGARLLLIGRDEDSAWLLTQIDDDGGWVRRADVIVFNTDRLSVAAAAPPAENSLAASESASALQEMAGTPAAMPAGAVTPTVAPSTDRRQPAAAVITEPASGNTGDTGEALADRTVVTGRLDVSKAKGLNIRSGPDAAYARVGAIDAEDSVIVTGRNHAGDWVLVESADGALHGWAATYYLTITGNPNQLPEVQSAAPAAAETPVAPASTSVPPEALPAPTVSVTAASVQSVVSTGLEGTLVFQTGQGGTIYAYELETGRLWPLTTGFDPAISPDGEKVAFTRIGDNGGLYLINIDGSNERRIYTGPRIVASPQWSEDGAQIAFNYSTSARECRDMGSGNCVSDEQFSSRRYRDLDPNDYPLITVYTYDIGVIDADGGNSRSLSSLDTARALDWGDGGIVYQSSDGIQIISAEGGESTVILFDPLKQVDQDPVWVGGSVVFQRPGASHWQIWRADANGANVTALTQPQTVLVNQLPSSVAPASSPDGSQIVFLSNRTDSGEAGAWRIWVMDANGSNQRPLPIDVPIHYTFGAEQMVSWGR